MSASAPPPTRTVVLRHELPDGSFHYDWMFEPAPASSSLLTFRLSLRPDSEHRELHAERLQDHRAEYLSYEGPISGNRGHVTRELTGACTITTSSPDTIEIEVQWPTSRLSYALRRAGDHWLIHARPAPVR